MRDDGGNWFCITKPVVRDNRALHRRKYEHLPSMNCPIILLFEAKSVDGFPTERSAIRMYVPIPRFAMPIPIAGTPIVCDRRNRSFGKIPTRSEFSFVIQEVGSSLSLFLSLFWLSIRNFRILKSRVPFLRWNSQKFVRIIHNARSS